MNGPIDGLLSTLHLTDTGARTTEDIFTGPSQWMPLGRVFGGQVLAQSLIAAMHTVPDERTIHSMHGYFLRPGDVEHPITFSVDRLHDGRSFSTRRTHAYQNGVPILSLIASFQTDDDGVEHQVDMPTDLPDPEDLPLDGRRAGRLRPRHRAVLVERARVRRAAHPVAHLPLGRGGSCSASGGVDEGIRPAARRSQAASRRPRLRERLLDPRAGAARPRRRPGRHPGLKVASLDHAMWWHRDARVDEWLLYVQESPSASGGRGLCARPDLHARRRARGQRRARGHGARASTDPFA